MKRKQYLRVAAEKLANQQNYNYPVVIDNCTFAQNKNFQPTPLSSSNSSLLYSGTILTHKVDIEFRGHCVITGNKAGSGLYSSNANININGHVIFYGNSALSAGGAMGLTDVSRLVFYPGGHLRFENNYSSDKGGAIAVRTLGMPELTYVHNPFCFLQYLNRDLPHSMWDVSTMHCNF